MEVRVFETSDDVGAAGAAIIVKRIVRENLRNLGVATGSSPQPIYRALRAYPPATFAALRLFALDEYVGLATDDRQSYRSAIEMDVAVPLGIDLRRVYVPDGVSHDLQASCLRFEEEIDGAGGIDLQILGIGTTGHIAFNEPGSSLTSRTHVVSLTPQTRSDNARFFASEDHVPLMAITQGVGTILAASELLLVATGKAKAGIIGSALEGPISSDCPASAIQLHPSVTVLLDEEAASALTHRTLSRV